MGFALDGFAQLQDNVSVLNTLEVVSLVTLKAPSKKHFFLFMTQRKSGMNSRDTKLKEVSSL